MKRKYLVKDRKKLQALSTLRHTRLELFKACLRLKDFRKVVRREVSKQFKMTKGNELAWDAQVKLWLMKRK